MQVVGTARINTARYRVTWLKFTGDAPSFSFTVPGTVLPAGFIVVPSDEENPWTLATWVSTPEMSTPKMAGGMEGMGSSLSAAYVDYPSLVPPNATVTVEFSQPSGSGSVVVYIAIADYDY